MPARRTYARNQSRLYKIKSPAQLATVLLLKQSERKLLEEADDNYIRWIDKKTGRAIQKPKPLLEKVHRRVGILLARIETPEFLHSAGKGPFIHLQHRAARHRQTDGQDRHPQILPLSPRSGSLSFFPHPHGLRRRCGRNSRTAVDR